MKPLHSLFAGLMLGVGEPTLVIDGSTPPWSYQPDVIRREEIATADIVVWSGVELER
jgi:zinc transport system substrate-binding protein